MIELFFAGLWPIIGRLGIGAIIIIAALGWFFLAPAFLGFKKTALWVAGTAFVVLLAYTTGVYDANNRHTAREKVTVDRVETTAKADRAAVDRSIKPEPRSLRTECLERKAAYDRC